LYHTEDKQGALATLARAIELHGQDPWEWAVLLGDWHLELGDWEEAVSSYQQAQAWNPGETSIQQRIEKAQSLR
jgi:Flp pilus assembly protein TadD